VIKPIWFSLEFYPLLTTTLLEQVTEILGNKFSNVTTNLLLTMSANGRIGEAAKVVDAYCELMDTARGALTAVIVSATPLSSQQQTEVEKAVVYMLSQHHDEGKQVELIFEQDPNLIGGLKILVGDQVMDLSIASRMTELEMALEGSN
jgi:F-type H+-transporting ATPase subunit delta